MDPLSLLNTVFATIGPFFLLLGVLIFVHEFGHFIVAKYFGVRVEVFSLGFGKKVLQYKKGDTNYCLSLIPLGGYVKMYGDDPNKDIPEDQKKYSFLHKPVWPRIAIVAAGPLINFFFAILVFAVVGMVGEKLPANFVGDIEKNTAAFDAGFRSGDKIEKINGQDIKSWLEVNKYIQESAKKPVSFNILRDGESVELKATPSLEPNQNIFSLDEYVGEIKGLTTFSQSSLIGVSSINALAAKWGIRNLDIIEEINGEKVFYFRDIAKSLLNAPQRFEIKVRQYSEEKVPTRSIDVTDWALPEGMTLNEVMGYVGLEDPSLFLLKVRDDSPAYQAGLEKGDKIVSLDGEPVSQWQEVLNHVKNFKETDKKVVFGVVRDGITKDISIRPELTELPTPDGQREERFTVGIIPAYANIAGETFLRQTLNPFKAIAFGARKSVEWTGLMLMSFVRLGQGKVSARNIGGVITIGRVASQSYKVGISAFLRMMAIISINLFLLNLFPIPVLDGGHLLFFFFEAVNGAPLSLKKMEIAQTVGIVLLMSLMTFALFNDVTNWLASSGW